MMLKPLPVPGWLSKSLAGKVGQLNDSIESINTRIADYAREIEHLSKGDVNEFDAGNAVLRDDRLAIKIDLLKEQLAIARDSDAMWSSIDEERKLEADRAIRRVEEVRDDIIAKLEAIGFVNTGHWDQRVRGSIHPAMLANHPDVRAANDHVKHIHDASLYNTQRRNAAEAIEAILSRLRKIRCGVLRT